MMQKSSLHTRSLTLGEACHVSGVDPRRATNWFQRQKVVLGQAISPKRRLLSPWEVLQLALIARLNLLPVETAATIANEAMAQVAKAAAAHGLETIQGLADWGRRLGLFVFHDVDAAHGYRVQVQSVGYTLEGVIHALEAGTAPASFYMVPLGELSSVVAQRIEELDHVPTTNI